MASGIDKILEENGWTREFMDGEWERAMRALDDGCKNPALAAFANESRTWVALPKHLIVQVPGLADRMYTRKAEREAKEAAEEAERKARAEARSYYYDHVEEILVAKIDAGEELSESEVEDLVMFCDHYADEEGDDRRWTREVTTYIRTEAGRFFRICWERGLTESQEDFYLEQPVEVCLHEREKVIRVVERTWTEVGDAAIAEPADEPDDAEGQWLPYTADQARRDAIAARGEAGHGDGVGAEPADEHVREDVVRILVEELAAVRTAAESGMLGIDAAPEHVRSGLWPYVRQMLEMLGFTVRNIVNSRMERQGATIFWDGE